MTQVLDYPLSSTFAGVNTLQANGIIDTGNDLPNGIPGYLDIVNQSMRATITNNDAVTAGGIRSEITQPATATTGEFWYTWQFMLPETFAPLLDPLIISQIHPPDDLTVSVPFALYYQQPGYLAAAVPVQTLPAIGTSSIIIGQAPLIRGHWYNACLHANWQTTAIGFREFFLDDVPLFKQYNVPTTYTDASGNYFKCGLYDATHNARFGSCYAYYANVTQWSGNDGYATVMGGLPKPSPLIIED